MPTSGPGARLCPPAAVVDSRTSLLATIFIGTVRIAVVFDCDLHTHSRFFHLSPAVGTAYDPFGVRLSLRVAHRRGLDGIAITNHDFFRPETITADTCLPGIEISTTAGHLLVVGPDPPTRTEPGELDPLAAVELAHDHGCAAIIAHPLRNSTLVDYDAPYDAIRSTASTRSTADRSNRWLANTASPSSAGVTRISRSRWGVSPRASTSTP